MAGKDEVWSSLDFNYQSSSQAYLYFCHWKVESQTEASSQSEFPECLCQIYTSEDCCKNIVSRIKAYSVPWCNGVAMPCKNLCPSYGSRTWNSDDGMSQWHAIIYIHSYNFQEQHHYWHDFFVKIKLILSNQILT